MNRLFFTLYVPAVVVLLLLGMLAGYVAELCEKYYRRWQVRKEMQTAPRHTPETRIIGGETLTRDTAGHWYRVDILQRRRELDGLATAQDKATRRIVH
jgi:hypothetical protein